MCKRLRSAQSLVAGLWRAAARELTIPAPGVAAINTQQPDGVIPGLAASKI